MESMNLYEFMKCIDVAVIFYAIIALGASGLIYMVFETIDLVKDGVKTFRRKRAEKKAAKEATTDKVEDAQNATEE